MEELNLKKVFETESETEIMILRGLLENDGIKSFVSGMDAGSALGSIIDGNEVIELFVSEALEAKAMTIVEQFEAEDESPIPAWTCSCGEEVDEGFSVCWSCEAEYMGDDPTPE